MENNKVKPEIVKESNENNVKTPDSILENIVNLLKESGSIKTSFNANSSVKFYKNSDKLTLNGKEIKSLEDLPEPLKSLAKKFLKDSNNDNVPDIAENVLKNADPKTKAKIFLTAKLLNIDGFEDKNYSSNAGSVSLSNKEDIIKERPPFTKVTNKSNKPIDVAGNPLNKLQLILIIILLLGLFFYFFI